MATALVAISLAGLAIANPAEAASTYLRECKTTATVTFTPKLTTTFRTGTLVNTYTSTCVREYTNGGTGTETYTWTGTSNYSGSCISASIDDPTNPTDVGLLVGGTTMIRSGTDVLVGTDSVAVWVLVSSNLNPCDMTTATATAVSAGVTWGSIP